MPLSKDQARELAQSFRDISTQLGEFRFRNWGNLSLEQRQSIEDAEWTLLNYSNELITTAVGLVLNDMQADLNAISAATAHAKKVIETINTVQDVLTVTASLIMFGGSIASGNYNAILSASQDLYNTATRMLKK